MSRIGQDYRLQHAIDTIKGDYGKTVSIRDKRKPLIKFGRNDDIDANVEELVWLSGGFETLPTDNIIDEIVSDNAADTQEVVVEGHVLENGVLIFKIQTVTLNGTTPVTLNPALIRATRLYNNDTFDFSGIVTVSDSTNSNDHLTTSGENNQSLKCAATIQDKNYWILTQLTASVNRQNSRSVDFRLKTKEFGKVFRTRLPFSCHSQSGTIVIDLDPCIVVPANADVIIAATSSGDNTSVNASIAGYLAQEV